MAACFYFIEERLMKMSDVFELPVCCSIEDKMGGGECITFDTPYHNLSDAHGSAVDVAINNYDRMANEIAELRGNQVELLKAVKFLLSKAENLNELQSINISSMIEFNENLLNK